TAECLRALPVQALVDNFTTPGIPGVVDGRVLTESLGTALAAGRFARVPILNGNNHDEELLFTLGLGIAVSGGTFAGVPVHRPVPGPGGPGPAAAGREQARGVGRLRRRRRSAGLAAVRPRRAGHVARPAATARVDGLCRRTPVRVLVRDPRLAIR